MKKFSQLFFLIILVFSLFGVLGCKVEESNVENSSQTEIVGEETPSPPETLKKVAFHREIYDSSKNQFLYEKGGISERVINQNIMSLEKENLWKYRIVDSVEVNSKFRSFEENEAIFSRVVILTKMVENFRILETLKNTDVDELREEYVPLKNIMTQLDSICNGKDDYETFKKVYGVIGRNIGPSDTNKNIFVHEVLNKKGGVCADIVAAFYPVLAYYGFQVGFRHGNVDDTGHIWLWVKIQNQYFELDPTWYGGNMIPFEDRMQESDEYFSLKDKFVTKR